MIKYSILVLILHTLVITLTFFGVLELSWWFVFLPEILLFFLIVVVITALLTVSTKYDKKD